MLLIAGWHCPVEAAPSTSLEQQVDAQQSTTAAVGVRGEDLACARCHKDIVRSFVHNPHASEVQASHISGMSCADCHGRGEEHIQSAGDKSQIFNPAKAAPMQIDDSCLKCHAGKHEVFERSVHARNHVSCVRCHSIHAAAEPKYLLKTAQPELCFQCHDEQRTQFSAVFRHKVKEGLVLCTDCHEPHGSFGEQLQRFPEQQDFICTKCHTEMAGPFKFEHDIVKTEGCIACHFPHGGPNAHMLNRARVNTICLLCHFPPPMSSTGESLIQAHDPAAKGKLCTDCHADIHGSDASAAFLKKNSLVTSPQ